jgi:hypothetical protein
MPDSVVEGVALVPGADGSVYLVGRGGTLQGQHVYRCDARGRLTRLAAPAERRAVALAFWHGQAVSVQDGTRLRVGPLAVAAARPK